MSSPSVFVSGAFDDLRSRDVRFLEEASKLGPLTVLLWPDEVIHAQTGQRSKFPLAERDYFLQSVRYVERVRPCPPVEVSGKEIGPGILVELESSANESRRATAAAHGLEYEVIPERQLAGFPEPPPIPGRPGSKKVIVTGCYDWFHSGHVRFFEEVSSYGDLYVVVGHDANIRLLKGEGHPLLRQEERRYMAGSIRFVTQCLISTGTGWLDADPEIQRLRPDIYAVNEDGDKGGKRDYCQQRGIEYLVLRRTPAPGLPARSSTNLRGF